MTDLFEIKIFRRDEHFETLHFLNQETAEFFLDFLEKRLTKKGEKTIKVRLTELQLIENKDDVLDDYNAFLNSIGLKI